MKQFTTSVSSETTILERIFGTRWNNPVKLDRERKGWQLKEKVIRQLVRQLVYQFCQTRYQVSFYLWWTGSVLKYCKVPKYYDQDCSFTFSIKLFFSLNFVFFNRKGFIVCQNFLLFVTFFTLKLAKYFFLFVTKKRKSFFA